MVLSTMSIKASIGAVLAAPLAAPFHSASASTVAMPKWQPTPERKALQFAALRIKSLEIFRVLEIVKENQMKTEQMKYSKNTPIKFSKGEWSNKRGIEAQKGILGGDESLQQTAASRSGLQVLLVG
jgi:hypothetical protein